jgi:citrate lyase subunit beta/citryl-CoA lyase
MSANPTEAGRSGGDIRSDCRVVFEARNSGGVQIELASRVEAYYGDNIRAQARQVLAELGVSHAVLTIEDMGALPFVIAARIEAAVCRSGLEERKPAHREPNNGTQSHCAPGTAKDRFRRSRLYLPGNEPKYFINAGQHGPDAIILDLEDSVHPAEKDAARLLVRNALREVDFNGSERMLRINQLPLGLKDIQEVVAAQPDVILIPKVETAEQIKQVDAAIHDARYAGGTGELSEAERAHKIWLMPILESALAIENAFAIATASKHIVALTIGLEDYTADLGVVKTRGGGESLYARLRLVNAAHAAGVQAIDSVYSDVGDAEGLLNWGRRARMLGFEGMGCLHPAQIPIVHQAFAPSAEEVEKARKIVAAFEEAQAHGKNVVALGSKMIDPPVVKRALKLVEQARKMGMA